jgi:hypothetical protein
MENPFDWMFPEMKCDVRGLYRCNDSQSFIPPRLVHIDGAGFGKKIHRNVCEEGFNLAHGLLFL